MPPQVPVELHKEHTASENTQMTMMKLLIFFLSLDALYVADIHTHTHTQIDEWIDEKAI